MKRIVSFAVVVALAALMAGTALAQTKAPAKAPAPAPAPSQAVVGAWNEIGRKLIAMAEDWPEDKYDFKPNPQVRSFAEQLLHAAGANYYYTDVVQGKKPAQEDLPRSQYKTKADVVAAVKKSFADAAAITKSKGDAGMNETVKHPFANAMTRVGDLAYDLIAHAGEHYGQLVVYYRVNNMVPPESRPRK